jgi:hypothetical protein
MKSIVPFASLTIIALTIALGCVKPPEYPIEPLIQYLSLSKDTMNRGDGSSDSIQVTLTFTDGDGDIGTADLEKNLFYTDDRDGFIQPYQIPFVPEQGASNGIKGEIRFSLLNSCCDFPDSLFSFEPCKDEFPSFRYDEINFTVYIVDRKGHKSNEVQLPPVYVKCFD